MNYKKKISDLNKKYWETKYLNDSTGWDIGEISKPLEVYFNQITDKNIDILIPGAGNSYEAEYLHKNKFKTVDIIDIASQPLQNLKNRVLSFPKENLIHNNFFNHSKKYDLIIEQTFFCALHPESRNAYVEKMASLLNEHGKIVGLFFDFKLTEEGPPFGGSYEEYSKLFSRFFQIKVLERCYNSIKPRFGRELFFIFEKK